MDMEYEVDWSATFAPDSACGTTAVGEGLGDRDLGRMWATDGVAIDGDGENSQAGMVVGEVLGEESQDFGVPFS